MVYCGNEVSLPQYVGACLKNERKKQGLTQEAFAEMACVSTKTVQRWEKGVDSLTTLFQIAELLHLHVEDTFHQTGDVLPSKLHHRPISEATRTHHVLVVFFICFILKSSSDTANQPKEKRL